MTDDLDQCTKEIEQAESLLRAGHPDVEGLMACLQDWRDEARIIREGQCASSK